MQTGTFQYPKIQVTMLGEFSITINGNQCTNLKGRTKRVWMLIEYLLANRKKDISLDKLVDILWDEGECGDPLNALKNLVYRARSLLRDISGNDSAEFIKYERNTYSWNNLYECSIDTEQFTEFWYQGNDITKPEESRIESYKSAIALYRGDFLPKSSYSSWVTSSQIYFSTIFNECVLKVSNLLIDSQCMKQVIEICESALLHSPLEESIHKLLLYAYISMDQRNKALDHYNYCVSLFYKELGVDISTSLRPLYKQLISSINHIEIDLSVIKKRLKRSIGGERGVFL